MTEEEQSGDGTDGDRGLERGAWCLVLGAWCLVAWVALKASSAVEEARGRAERTVGVWFSGRRRVERSV